MDFLVLIIVGLVVMVFGIVQVWRYLIYKSEAFDRGGNFWRSLGMPVIVVQWMSASVGAVFALVGLFFVVFGVYMTISGN